MKIIIIGGVAAGTSAAAKARRNDEQSEIIIYEKDSFISYSGCAMPYYIGGEVEDIETLAPRNPAFFKKKYNIDIKTQSEVLSIDSKNNTLTIKDLCTEKVFTDKYDKLVIATGAIPFKPPIDGIENDNVFFLRNVFDAISIKKFIAAKKCKNALIAGTGFIGFEVLENLMQLGFHVNVVEVAEKITPNLDTDMAAFFESELTKNGISIKKNTSITQITQNTAILSDGSIIEADIFILSTGVRPNTSLAREAGVELGETKAIKVNAQMQTNIENIYACGDCIETFSSITQKAVYRPLGSTANKTGRIAGDALSGGSLFYKGNLSTGIFKVFDITIATTGLSEKEAIENGYDIEICHNIKPNKPDYMGGKEMVIKAIADKKTQQLLGVQIIGFEGVDKRIDVFATLLTYKAKVDELFHLDLAYAPPFSTTKDPVHYTGMILDNAINNGRGLMNSQKLQTLNEKIQIIDARSESDYKNKGCVCNAVNIPQDALRVDSLDLDKDALTITYCNKGVTGNAAQNILINRGFKKVLNLSGGHTFFKGSKQ